VKQVAEVPTCGKHPGPASEDPLEIVGLARSQGNVVLVVDQADLVGALEVRLDSMQAQAIQEDLPGQARFALLTVGEEVLVEVIDEAGAEGDLGKAGERGGVGKTSFITS
jgi:hypothetical protein